MSTKMLPTPSTSHLSFDRIYEPAEDTFLLLDTLSSASETAFLHARFAAAPLHRGRSSSPAPLLLEVGTGSGVVLAFLVAHARTILGRADVAALATDVNLHACEAARATVPRAVAESRAQAADPGEHGPAGTLLGVLAADLATPLRAGTVDLVVANPPYVPTDEAPAAVRARLACAAPSLASPPCASPLERDADLLALAYAGGRDGMETTARLLADLARLLHPRRGVAYVLLCARNRPDDVAARVARGEWGPRWRVERVADSGRRAGWESLQVLRIWRAEEDD